MPNIRQYSPQIEGLRPDERGVDAALTVARRGGSIFNQAADAVRTVGNQVGSMLGGSIRAAGDVAVDYVTTREVSQGAAAFTSLQQKMRDQWNETAKTADPNDPTVAARFREKVIEPEIEKFGEQFMTDGGRKFAQSHLASLRESLVHTMTADMSQLASSAVAVNMRQTGNALSNTAASDPSTVPTLLAQADSLVGGIIDSTPNLKGATASKARMELTQRTKEEIVKSGAVAAIAKSGNPEAEAELWSKKYPEYLSGGDAKALAGNARQQIRAARTDAAYMDHLQKEKAQAESDNRVDQYLKNLYDPENAETVTARGVVNDQTLTRRDKDYLLTRIDRVLKPETDAQRSAQTTTGILSRMQAPEGAPDRITDIEPIYDAFKKGDLTRTDTDWLIKQFRENRTPEGQRIGDNKTELLKAVSGSITNSNPLQGKIDPSGDMMKYRFQKDLDAEIDAYRKAGKNPYDLFDPAKPDFFGRPENVARYQVPLSQSVKNASQRLRSGAVPGANPNLAPLAPTVAPVPRKPGESAAEYLKRTGRP